MPGVQHCGVVRCSAVRCGAVWCGVVQCAVLCCGLAPLRIVLPPQGACPSDMPTQRCLVTIQMRTIQMRRQSHTMRTRVISDHTLHECPSMRACMSVCLLSDDEPYRRRAWLQWLLHFALRNPLEHRPRGVGRVYWRFWLHHFYFKCCCCCCRSSI